MNDNKSSFGTVPISLGERNRIIVILNYVFHIETTKGDDLPKLSKRKHYLAIDPENFEGNRYNIYRIYHKLF